MARALIYTTRDCCLCEEAQGVLAEFSLEIETVDISDDPEKLAEFGVQVPVVFIDGRKRFIGRVDRMLLRRVLAASGGGAPRG